MKLKIIAIIFAFLLCACSAWAAGFAGPGGQTVITRAADVFGAWDDAPCELTGRIVEKIRGRKHRYLFEDSSGTVVVDIKRHVFGSFTVTPEHLVRLIGEVEADDKYPNEVEVDYLAIIGPAKQFENSQRDAGG